MPVVLMQNAFFDGDDISWKDFAKKIQGVYDLFKSGQADEAIDECHRLFVQIEILISQFTETDQFPKSAVPLLAAVLVERAKDALKEGANEFDLAAGKLCEFCFPTMPADRGELWDGFFKLVALVFAGQFGDDRPPLDYIHEKQSQGPSAETDVEIAIAIAKSLADKKVLELSFQLAHEEGTPLIFQVIRRIFNCCERIVRSPPQDVSPLPKGYVSTMAWQGILVALCFKHVRPTVTSQFFESA